MENENTVFHVENLSLAYGEKQVLKNINIDIKEHKVTAFIGPSGCGKSTFLRCFNRMNDLIRGCHIEGTMLYGGKEIKEMDPMTLRTEVGSSMRRTFGSIARALAMHNLCC